MPSDGYELDENASIMSSVAGVHTLPENTVPRYPDFFVLYSTVYNTYSVGHYFTDGVCRAASEGLTLHKMKQRMIRLMRRLI